MTPARSQPEDVLDNVRHTVRRVHDALHALFGFGIKPGSGRHSHHHLTAQRGARVAVAQLRGWHTDRRHERMPSTRGDDFMRTCVRGEDMGTDERRNYSDLAQLVVGGLLDALVGRSHDGAQIVTVFHYGAVDIDPKHLVVWILLDGPRSDEVPEWLSVGPLLRESLR